MGGGEKKKANQMADQQYKNEMAAQNQFSSQQAQERVGARARADDLYDTMSGGYKNLIGQRVNASDIFGAGRGGVSAPQFTRAPEIGESLGLYRDFAKGGGIDEDKMREGYGTYRDFMNTGGVDAGRRASIEDTIGMFKNMGRTGGLDDTAMARMRGGGGFDEFAKTGGYSDSDRANIRSRATSTIPAAYARANDEAKRMGVVQGGYGPGVAALRSRNLRQANQENAAAARDAELGIMDRVNAGRQYGITGMAQSENALQGLRTGNMLQGMSGAGNLDSDLMHTIQSGKMWGANSINDDEARIQGMLQQGRMFGTQGVNQVGESNQAFSDRQAQANASAANANSANDAEAQRWAAEFNRQNQLYGLGGLGELYSGAPGEVGRYDENNLRNRGLTNDIQGSIIGQKYAMNPSWADRLQTMIPGIAGAAGGVLTGIGDFRTMGRRPRQVTAG